MEKLFFHTSVVSFVIFFPVGHFVTPQPTSVLLTFVVFLMRYLTLVSRMSAPTSSSVVPLQHVHHPPKLSESLKAYSRAIYYDQQLHFISKCSLEVMYVTNMIEKHLENITLGQDSVRPERFWGGVS